MKMSFSEVYFMSMSFRRPFTAFNTEFHNGLRRKISGLLLVKLLAEEWLLRVNVFT